MTIFTLRFPEHRHGPAKDIQFEAVDPGAAFLLAQREAPERPAELWEGTRKICTLTQGAGGVWQLSA
ncbi:hypothetical protein WBP06_03315 [Novosphingobium sp. BL-8H]|uniref:hypothetical protein n=1 Tax=Novosphingobium sp. BL-8H TaxID=3127640 RepID=UPI00375635E4